MASVLRANPPPRRAPRRPDAPTVVTASTAASRSDKRRGKHQKSSRHAPPSLKVDEIDVVSNYRPVDNVADENLTLRLVVPSKPKAGGTGGRACIYSHHIRLVDLVLPIEVNSVDDYDQEVEIHFDMPDGEKAWTCHVRTGGNLRISSNVDMFVARVNKAAERVQRKRRHRDENYSDDGDKNADGRNFSRGNSNGRRTTGTTTGRMAGKKFDHVSSHFSSTGRGGHHNGWGGGDVGANSPLLERERARIVNSRGGTSRRKAAAFHDAERQLDFSSSDEDVGAPSSRAEEKSEEAVDVADVDPDAADDASILQPSLGEDTEEDVPGTSKDGDGEAGTNELEEEEDEEEDDDEQEATARRDRLRRWKGGTGRGAAAGRRRIIDEDDDDDEEEEQHRDHEDSSSGVVANRDESGPEVTTRLLGAVPARKTAVIDDDDDAGEEARAAATADVDADAAEANADAEAGVITEDEPVDGPDDEEDEQPVRKDGNGEEEDGGEAGEDDPTKHAPPITNFFKPKPKPKKTKAKLATVGDVAAPAGDEKKKKVKAIDAAASRSSASRRGGDDVPSPDDDDDGRCERANANGEEGEDSDATTALEDDGNEDETEDHTPPPPEKGGGGFTSALSLSRRLLNRRRGRGNHRSRGVYGKSGRRWHELEGPSPDASEKKRRRLEEEEDAARDAWGEDSLIGHFDSSLRQPSLGGSEGEEDDVSSSSSPPLLDDHDREEEERGEGGDYPLGRPKTPSKKRGRGALSLVANNNLLVRRRSRPLLQVRPRPRVSITSNPYAKIHNRNNGGSSKRRKKSTSPHVGLRNLGNTCYLNATLQMLFSLRGFVGRVVEWEREGGGFGETAAGTAGTGTIGAVGALLPAPPVVAQVSPSGSVAEEADVEAEAGAGVGVGGREGGGDDAQGEGVEEMEDDRIKGTMTTKRVRVVDVDERPGDLGADGDAASATTMTMTTTKAFPLYSAMASVFGALRRTRAYDGGGGGNSSVADGGERGDDDRRDGSAFGGGNGGVDGGGGGRGTRSSSDAAGHVKRAMDRLDPTYVGNQQRDAHEFLLDLLDKMHDEEDEAAAEAATAATTAVETEASAADGTATLGRRLITPTRHLEEVDVDGDGPPPPAPSGEAAAPTRHAIPGGEVEAGGGEPPLASMGAGEASDDNTGASAAAATVVQTPHHRVRHRPPASSQPRSSPTDEYFKLRVRVRLVCDSCGYSRSRVEVHRHLSLDLEHVGGEDVGGGDATTDAGGDDSSQSPPSASPPTKEAPPPRLMSVEDGLRRFFADERREISCEKCPEGRTCTQSVSLVGRMPGALLLHLKRFTMDADDDDFRDDGAAAPVTYSKNSARVTFPPVLSLGGYHRARPCGEDGDDDVGDGDGDGGAVTTPGDDDDVTDPVTAEATTPPQNAGRYELRSVVHHIGRTPFRGHYTADAALCRGVVDDVTNDLSSQKISGNSGDGGLVNASSTPSEETMTTTEGKEEVPEDRRGRHRSRRQQWTRFDDGVAFPISLEEAVDAEESQRNAYMVMYEFAVGSSV